MQNYYCETICGIFDKVELLLLYSRKQVEYG